MLKDCARRLERMCYTIIPISEKEIKVKTPSSAGAEFDRINRWLDIWGYNLEVAITRSERDSIDIRERL